VQYNPQQARQQWQNRVNNAQGHIFEDGIKAACQVYQGSGRATVDKTPEPFRVMEKRRDGKFSVEFDHVSFRYPGSETYVLKDLNLKFEIGEKMAAEYGVAWLLSDFKKRDGYKRSIELSKEYDLYRQDYCGCVYSRMEREKQRQKE